MAQNYTFMGGLQYYPPMSGSNLQRVTIGKLIRYGSGVSAAFSAAIRAASVVYITSSGLIFTHLSCMLIVDHFLIQQFNQ
jgi:hypothetical protein